jgi:4,5-DOPA dioxygenase extradiol
VKRRQVLTLVGSSLVGAIASSLTIPMAIDFFSKSGAKNGDSKMKSEKMPILFFGHGSPMNAIENNNFTKAHSEIGKKLPPPKAILMISAHWMTQGTWVTHMPKPKTIHDFGGFPRELFAVEYPAPGSPEVAEMVQSQILNPKIGADDNEWGLDHGTWSVLKHVYPDANIPVVQLSLDMTKPPEYHFELGKKLRNLREQGVLIMASGNIVHNLRRISWDENAPVVDWAIEFDEWVKAKINSRDFQPLVKDSTNSPAGQLSIPTPDHYYPLLYILGASTEKDELSYVTEGFQNGSISMRSIKFG